MAAFLVAVTGGVASGKSEATGAFEALGVAVVDADIAARAVVAPGEPALADIVARFGPGSLQADGHLDRAAMRRLVFADPSAKADLEALLHPRIRAWLQAACAAAPGPVCGRGGSRCWPKAARAMPIRGCSGSWSWTSPCRCSRRD